MKSSAALERMRHEWGRRIEANAAAVESTFERDYGPLFASLDVALGDG